MAGPGPAIVVSYVGRDVLRIAARGHVIFADQTAEDGGDDTALTPTELLVASLGSCVGFYAERFLRRNGMSTDGLRIACSYRWAEKPHRVGEIELAVEAPGLTEGKREAFERVIDHCTVHNTLRGKPDVRVLVTSPAVVA
jgi:putative redox protein